MIILVEGIDDGHILLLNGKIEDGAICGDPVRMRGFGDDSDTFLNGPAQTDLCGGPPVFRAQHTHHIIVKVCASGQGGLGLDHNAAVLAIFDQLFGIAQGVAFDLVHSRHDAGNFFQFFQMPDLKIADADRKSAAGR